MGNLLKHSAGNFCWFELGTSDQNAAKEFYTKLFGWSFTDNPMGEGMGDYTMLKLDGKDVGALYQLGREMQGVPPHWATYVAVESADRTAARATELGGDVLAPPFDVSTHGRMTIIKDPTGATICVWEPKEHYGADLVGQPGSACWCELATRDTATAKAFFTALFGWDLKESQNPTMEYTELINGGRPIGGMMPMQGDQWKGVPPHWLIYFMVDDCDATVKRATELGGKTIVTPTDIPNTGRFSIIQDPQGAVFAVIKLLPMPH